MYTNYKKSQFHTTHCIEAKSFALAEMASDRDRSAITVSSHVLLPRYNKITPFFFERMKIQNAGKRRYAIVHDSSSIFAYSILFEFQILGSFPNFHFRKVSRVLIECKELSSKIALGSGS